MTLWAINTSFAYDYLGCVTSTTEKNGNINQYILDKNGNITQTTDALGSVSHFSYDAMNRLISVKQGLAQEQITAYNYDYRGLLTSETNPLGMSKTYQYNLGGLLTKRVDEEAYTATYTYDQMGRATQIYYTGSGVASQTITYAYNLAGMLTNYTDPSGATSITRDLLGRVTQVKYPGNRTLGYAWDPVGNLNTVTYADNTQALYGYDAENRITSLTDPKSGTTAFTYDPNGNLISRLLPNGEETDYSYDALNRVLAQTEGDYAINYVYDPMGNRVEENRETSGRFMFDRDKRPVTGAFAYEYDELNRLVEVNHPNFGATTYEYDSLGNMVRENGSGGEITYGYNDFNQLVQRQDNRTTTNYTFDNRGNLVLTMETPDGGYPGMTEWYAYDVTNRMTEATNEQSEYTSYMYDALGRRVSETQNRQPASHSTVKTYLPDLISALPRDLMVYTAGQTEERNVYANGLVEKLTVALPNYAGSDGVEDVLYAHSDVLGSLTYLTKDDGSGYMAFDYGAWGEVDLSQTLNDFDFVVTASYTGHDNNFVLGVWFAQARLYDSGDRRFMSVDPVEDGENWYVYCANNPLVNVDPTGLDSTRR